MFQNKYPLFNSGRLLKIEMLDELRDFPREIINIRFSDYSDGIISGCQININNDYLVIKKGLIKHNDILYILDSEYAIKYKSTNHTVMLKIKFLEEKKDNDFIQYSSEIFLDNKLEINNDELELCRFKLRTGAKLRINHVDFNDLCTEYDTVNIINSPYSAYEQSSLNPDILRRFGRELLKCSINDPWDITFGMTCIQSKEAIQKEIIVSYLVYKLNLKIQDYNNQEMYYYLLEILNKEKASQRISGHTGKGRFKKILID